MADQKKKENWSFGASLALLIILTIFTFGLGIASLLKNLRGPFVASININENLANSLTNQTPTIEEQKKADTDKDGLSDFDELYIYKTSPYLADTDSDGYNDKEEINTNHDPNCPFGESCQSGVPTNANSNANVNAPAGNANANVNTNSANTPLNAEQLKNLTPAQIRELLLETGKITKEQLDQIDDSVILQFYQEALKENAGQ